MIHPTAIVHSKAKLDGTTRVGPYTVIDEGVEIGPHCIIGPWVYLTGLTSIGAHNHFFAGCIIGEAPQDLKYQGEPTRLRIGSYNVFREHVTVHRSNQPGEETVVGSHNFLMQHSHVARGGNGICGLNTVGLRRAGFTPAERLELKQLYRLLFREGLNLRTAITAAQKQFLSAPAKVMLDFLAASKRGVCVDAGTGAPLDLEAMPY